MDSILSSVKKLLGIESEIHNFDDEVVMNINSVFFTLNQLGVGPEKIFSIKDASAVWADFPIDEDLQTVLPTYIYLKVRLVFDPPQNSTVIEAINRQISELEWRLNIQVEGG